MGCVFVKGVDRDDHEQRRGKGVLGDVSVGNDGSRARLISKLQQNVGTAPRSLLVERERKPEPVAAERARKSYQSRRIKDSSVSPAEPSSKVSGAGTVGEPNSVIFSVPNGFKGEHVAAGWPSWLTTVAGEAVKGWLPRRADTFEKLNKIGQGTYSSVYKARDLETGKFVALKKVRFVNMDPESVRFMAREIYILRRLEHLNVLRLEAIVTSRMSSSLYLVFEYMEHDLAGLAATPGIKFTESQVKCYMQQLLSGLDHSHNRGVLHRDIKCSNLLIDNNGILKIADFGLATIFNPEHKQSLTSRVVTLWYRPPELLLGATEYGVAVDLWSTGCILAELLAGRPIMPGRTEVEQLHRIFKLCGSPSKEFLRTSKLPRATTYSPHQSYPRCFRDTFKDFPSSALDLLDCLLAMEPAKRGTAASALESKFFTTKPFACDPSSLPKYPPSKEYDAKLRNEEAGRQREAAVKGHVLELGRRREALTPNDAVELEKQQMQGNLKARVSSYEVKETSGFPIEPLGGAAEIGFSNYGPVLHSRHSSTVGTQNGPEMKPKPFMLQDKGAALSITPGAMCVRSNTARLDHIESAKHLSRQQSRSRFDHLDDVSEKQEWTHHLLHGPPSSQKKDERAGEKKSTVGHGIKKNKIHYSGPLMPPGGNAEEMLKEHERKMQRAVRKARLDKAKNKNYGEKGQTKALLYASSNGK